MNKLEIGFNAGKIWNYLDSLASKSCTYDELMDATGLSERAMNQALGWLAREEQVFFDDADEHISLPQFFV